MVNVHKAKHKVGVLNINLLQFQIQDSSTKMQYDFECHGPGSETVIYGPGSETVIYAHLDYWCGKNLEGQT